MKAYTKSGAVWIEGCSFSICLDYGGDPALQIQEHLAEQKEYIKRLQQRVDAIEGCAQWQANSGSTEHTPSCTKEGLDGGKA